MTTTDQSRALADLIAALDRRSDYRREGMAFTAAGHLDLRSLTALPEGVSLSAGGYLDLGSLTALPEGVSLSAGGGLDLRSLTALPEGASLSAGGGLDLRSLTALPEGASLSAGGWLDLSSLTALPEGVSLSAGGWLDLRSLTALPEGVSLSAGGYLDLSSLTALPEGVSLSAGDWLDLGSLTTLPEGVSLSAGGWLDLRSLTAEVQRYQGVSIRLRTIDGICTRLIRSRRVGAATLWTAQYFRGDLDRDRRCFVAQQGDDYAHGDTAEAALRDLEFKVRARRPVDELVATIKARGTVEFDDYRLLTGACKSGMRQHLIAHGIDPDTTRSLPLARALEVSRTGYGGDRFARLMGGDTGVQEARNV